MTKDNLDFWREVWKRYPETEIVYGTEKGRMRERFYRDLLPTKKGLVLDLGCGDGHLRPFIENYVGLDVSREALTKIEGDTVLGSAEVLPFQDDSFDHVVLCEVFEHLVDRAKALREVRRILKPKGELILSCPYGVHPSHKSDSSILKSYGLPQIMYQDGRFNETYMKKLFEAFNFRVSFISIFWVKNVPNNLMIVGEKHE
jgi:SAM-dependent methyltransferase